MSDIESNRFDIVLLESVFGFVQDKAAAVAEMHRVLKPGGVIAVTDFHYANEPPGSLVQELSRNFGIHQILSRNDWERCFETLQLDAWCEVQMGTGGIDRQSVDLMLTDAGLHERFPGGAQGRAALAQRFVAWDEIFARNRRYMAGHNALWRKPVVVV